MRRLSILLTACLVLGLIGCDKQAEKVSHEYKQAAPSDVDVDAAGSTMWEQLEDDINAANGGAIQLQDAVKTLLATPDQNALLAAQQQWQQTQQSFAKLDYLFSMTQSAQEVLGRIFELKYRLLAYPIQPGYLDSYGEYKYAGLVYDIGTPISRESLRAQQGVSDSEEVVLGLYAIHYMLFGEANSRQASDYAEVDKLSDKDIQNQLKSVAEVPSMRRRLLLQTQLEQLVADTGLLTEFTRRDSEQRVQKVWRGLDASTQWQFARDGFKKCMIQALVDLTALQNQLSGDKAGELPTVSANDNPSLSADLLAVKIDSARAALPYISSAHRDSFQSLLGDTVKLLREVPTAGAEDKKTLLSSGFEKLKALGNL